MPKDLIQTDVAIIGGGLVGPSCAYRLNAAGVPSLVFEKEPFVGGRTKMISIADEFVPSGAGAVYRGTPTDRLCGELGIERSPIRPAAGAPATDSSRWAALLPVDPATPSGNSRNPARAADAPRP
ncbi:FAD-dependent oxidoreductase [Amycolatopsis sp. NBC_01480]|uniref:FAD-dependent oxidoreductase n=1 Tax=Amycolatopsis sp. NBC_01480 TaxID=2903562 RepID=UPI002E2B4648|nr:FAD-dependent oxidoreductase [Amycolatopsis sp. NBC_01480]